MKLSQRQNKILNFIQDKREASRQEVQDHINSINDPASRVTIIRDLKALLDNDLIYEIGKSRSVRYIIKQHETLNEINVDSYFAIDSDKRKLKNKMFNFDVFNALIPLFNKKEFAELEKLNNKYLNNLSKATPTALQKELERLTIEFSWKSSKIEGNTYTLLDTERLIKDDIEAKGHDKAEAVMILNHKKALDYVFSNKEHFITINIAKIEDLHRLVVDQLNITTGLRKSLVGIVGTDYKPLDNQRQIREALEKLVLIVNEISNPVEKAIIVVAMISYIQPFEDGNKRTARILGNAILLAHNYCPLSYRSVDEIEYKKAILLFYEQNNISYFKKLFVEQFKQAIDKYFG